MKTRHSPWALPAQATGKIRASDLPAVLRWLAATHIVRHGAAAITALVGLLFVAPLAGLAATPVGPYLPELIYANSLGATKPVQGFATSPWAGLAIIAAYAVVLLAVGGWLLTHRDA